MSDQIRCTRCQGLKFMYEINGGYSAVNSGGKKVDCPRCLGKGKIDTLDNASDEIKDEIAREMKKLKKNTSKKEVDVTEHI